MYAKESCTRTEQSYVNHNTFYRSVSIDGDGCWCERVSAGGQTDDDEKSVEPGEVLKDWGHVISGGVG